MFLNRKLRKGHNTVISKLGRPQSLKDKKEWVWLRLTNIPIKKNKGVYLMFYIWIALEHYFSSLWYWKAIPKMIMPQEYIPKYLVLILLKRYNQFYYGKYGVSIDCQEPHQYIEITRILKTVTSDYTVLKFEASSVYF